MRTHLCILLLAISLVPSWLAGQPRFHCHVTGIDAFVQTCCAPVEQEETCCARCAARELAEREARARMLPGDPSVESRPCDCCDVSFLKLVTTEPTRDLDNTLVAPPLLDLRTAETIADAILLGRTLPALERAPPIPEPPLPLRHAALRL